MSTSKITSPAMEIISGEMYIFGEKLPRHPEFPWLFSATALHKSCEEAIKLKASRDGKDPEKFFVSKRPGEWIKRNLINNEERIEQYAKHTRARIRKYGPNLGFGLTATYVAVKINELSDLDMVIQTKSGRYGGGSYLCQLAIVKYIETFSEKFRATVQNSFIAVVNGEVEEVTAAVVQNARIARGTPEREEDKAWSNEFKHSVAGKHASVPQAEAHLNLGMLGMTGKRWREKNSAGLPIQDYFNPHQLKIRKTAIADVVCDLSEDSRPKIASSEINSKCFAAGVRAKAIWEDPSIKEALDKIVSARVKEFEEKRGLKVARKRKPA